MKIVKKILSILLAIILMSAVFVGCGENTTDVTEDDAEQIELVPVHEGEQLQYYRRDGVHYVPKLTAEDLTL